jgi:hypothetical protein
MEGTVNQDEALKILADNKSQLSTWGKEFQASVSQQFIDKGKLTEQQWHWVFKLAGEIKDEKPVPVKVGQIDGIIELFNKAAQHLNHPVVVLGFHKKTAYGTSWVEMRLKRAATSSANPGAIYVYIADGYVGKITPGGDWLPNAAGHTYPEMLPVLVEFAADPAGVATKFGKLTGKCCFCNSKLTDPKSTDVGYGPVCAKHYGLPHGEVKVGTAAATAVLNEMEQISKNELAAELIEQVKAEDDFTDKLVDELQGVGLTVLTEADLPIELNQQAVENPDYTPPETVAQTHLEEPASQPPVTEPEGAPAPSQAPVRVEFDCKPGVAVKNLMEALNAK